MIVSQEGPGGSGASEEKELPRTGQALPEGFWSVVYRRARYSGAIVLSLALFSTLGWMLAAPPPDWGGVSLLWWSGAGGAAHGFFTALGLALMLLAATAVCTLLVHPDAPHMGLFCALLGLAGLSMRGGTVYMMVDFAQRRGIYREMSVALGVECIQWAIIFLIAEVFARLLHERFFANTHWITRSGPELDSLDHAQPGHAVMGVSLTVSRAVRTHEMRRYVATPLAMVLSGAAGLLLLSVLMQTQLKGQVMMACFVAFLVSTLVSYLAFPRVPILALLLTVPLTAAVGYWLGRNSVSAFPTGEVYPGQATFFAMRALPIDYVSMGIPGAILGYYGAYRWSLHSPAE